MDLLTVREEIDSLYSHPAMRKLMYWRAGVHKDDTFCAGNQAFADNVCELIDYAAKLEFDYKDK